MQTARSGPRGGGCLLQFIFGWLTVGFISLFWSVIITAHNPWPWWAYVLMYLSGPIGALVDLVMVGGFLPRYPFY